MRSGELEILDANANPRLSEFEAREQPLSAEEIEKVLKEGERVVRAGRDLQSLSKDALDLYDSIKKGDWEAAGRAGSKTIEDLLGAQALRDLGRTVLKRLGEVLSARQAENLSLPSLELTGNQ